MAKVVEKTKKKDGAKIGKKCMNCGLDCVISRGLAVKDVPDSKKAERLKVLYGDTKPAYNTENCKKR